MTLTDHWGRLGDIIRMVWSLGVKISKTNWLQGKERGNTLLGSTRQVYTVSQLKLLDNDLVLLLLQLLDNELVLLHLQLLSQGLLKGTLPNKVG